MEPKAKQLADKFLQAFIDFEEMIRQEERERARKIIEEMIPECTVVYDEYYKKRNKKPLKNLMKLYELQLL